MKITRTAGVGDFLQIVNSAVRDHQLSWRARGLLAELMSYPDGWETTVDKLVAQARSEGGNAEGRDAMLRAMSELAAAGYVRYIRRRGADRRISTTISVCDDPSRHPDVQCVENPVGRDSSVSADQCTGDQSVLKNTDINTDTKTDLGTLTDQYSASLTSFAAADADTSAARKLQTVLLDSAYTTINKLSDEQRRAALLVVERRRKKIYRDARNDALKQHGEEDPQLLRSAKAVAEMDALSLKYVAHHYITDSGELPAWFARPIGAA
jgi:hypothetical protein